MQAIVPVASCARVWSTRSAISCPGMSSPRSRCSSRIVRASEAIAQSIPERDPDARSGRIRAVSALLVCLGVVLIATACSHSARTRGTRLNGLGISVELPRGWHGEISKRQRPVSGAAFLVMDNATLQTEVTLSETLAGYDAPSEPARIEPGERRASVDRYVVKNGRSFWLHASFGSGPPPKQALRSANALLASLSVEPRAHPLRPAPDPVPARALRIPRLFPVPARILYQCRRAQARSSSPILCPRRLPRPFVKSRLRLSAYVLPAPGAAWSSRSDPRYRHRAAGGLTFGYGAPWEPDSGPDWRSHLWRNRPCCFLHFEVFRRAGGARQIPAGARPATMGGRHGLLKDATSWGLASPAGDYLYWPNHTRFLWRENGVDYVATLHRFGSTRETRALLARLMRELRPVRS